MKNDFETSSRSSSRAKRKKTNFILNGLIVIVLLLIAFVAYSIFYSGNDNASTKKSEPKTETKKSLHKDKSDKLDQGAVSNGGEGSDTSDDNSQMDDSSAGNTGESQAVSTQDDSSQITQTVENPDWKPAGTTQSGEHTANYDANSPDWQEMLNAISSAIGLEKSNMTVWFLGRDKSSSNGSVGTVSSKDKQEKYRVYIQWVDNQGWKPTKVEELSEIPNGN